MKVALVHDYIKEYGGAERVLEALHELFPEAPVYTSVYIPEFLGPHQERFRNWDIRTSLLQHLPLKQKLISPMRLLSQSVFKSFDFAQYDIIITSATGAYFPNGLDKKGAKLICYCHTPPRYLYGYITARDWKRNPFMNAAGSVANHFLRMIDYNAAQNVDQFLANSEEVKGRIKKFYRKDAVVVYPPVDIGSMKYEARSKEKRNYFLTGGRLARAKHNDLVIRVCNELKIPLKVFGKGFAGFEDKLKVIAGTTIEFVGEVSDEEKYELMSKAKAFLYASEDEDFGIIPVESMGCGTPVIAYKSGGVKETVVEGKTGLFYNDLSVRSLQEAIEKFGTMKFDTAVCRQQAEKFSKEKFMRNIKRVVEGIV